jgi:3-hydroxybutyryl-CoA dehydrogenase
MKLAICGPDELIRELTSLPDIEWVGAPDANGLAAIQDADGYFFLHEDASSLKSIDWKSPVFFHSVNHTLKEWSPGEMAYRINAWPGFLSRSSWEICGRQDERVNHIFSALNKEAVFVDDQVGMVSARVIAMIVNEAYFALEEDVSSPGEIDIALKLGTNYPMGPIEWGNKIGLRNIHSLLEKMATADLRYRPCEKLKTESRSS